MGKHLKDIVEDGFARLEELAEKRRHILARAQDLAKESLDPGGSLVESKLSESEAKLLDGMNQKSEEMLDNLKLTLEQNAESNRHFLTGIKENLDMRIEGTLEEIAKNRAQISSGIQERLDSLFAELEADSSSAQDSLNSEVDRLVSELEILCKGQSSVLLKTQSEIDAKLSIETEHLKSGLSEVLSQVLSNLDRKRAEFTESLLTSYRMQKQKLEKAYQEIGLNQSAVLSKEFERMKALSSEAKQSMVKESNKKLQETIDKLRTSSSSNLSTLEADFGLAYDSVHRRFNEMKSANERMLTDHNLAISQRDKEIKNKAAAIYMDLITVQDGETGGVARSQSKFIQTSIRLKEMSEGMSDFLGELLNSHSEELSILLASSTRNFANMMVDYRKQLLELLQEQEALCLAKEALLENQLNALERQLSGYENADADSSKISADGGLE